MMMMMMMVMVMVMLMMMMMMMMIVTRLYHQVHYGSSKFFSPAQLLPIYDIFTFILAYSPDFSGF